MTSHPNFDFNEVAKRVGVPVTPRALHVVDDQDAGPEESKAHRPASVVDMIGQETARVQLMTRLHAAKLRGEQPGHTLLEGPPGLGKTSMAEIIAHETGGKLVRAIASSVNTARMMGRELAQLNDGDVFFIDEIHGLSQATMELLYTAMEDGRIEITSGQGINQRSVSRDLAKFTLVGATTRSGKLTGPFRDRFALTLSLDYYSGDELARIIMRAAGKKATPIEPEAAHELGRRSRGTPRVALNLLDQVRDYTAAWYDDAAAAITVATVHAALKLYEIDALGLDKDDLALLSCLCLDHAGGPIGLSNLAMSVGQDNKTVEDKIEPFLIRAGLVVRQIRGRVATPKAYDHLREVLDNPRIKAPLTLGW